MVATTAAKVGGLKLYSHPTVGPKRHIGPAANKTPTKAHGGLWQIKYISYTYEHLTAKAIKPRLFSLDNQDKQAYIR